MHSSVVGRRKRFSTPPYGHVGLKLYSRTQPRLNLCKLQLFSTYLVGCFIKMSSWTAFLGCPQLCFEKGGISKVFISHLRMFFFSTWKYVQDSSSRHDGSSQSWHPLQEMLCSRKSCIMYHTSLRYSFSKLLRLEILCIMFLVSSLHLRRSCDWNLRKTNT